MSLNGQTNNNILEICLSKSWGGLEMFVCENAQTLAREAHKVGKTYTLMANPKGKLYQELKPKVSELGIELIAIRGRLDFVSKAKNFLAAIWIVQDLRDLKFVALALSFNPLKKKTELLGVSHSFVGVNKKDFLHRWAYGLVTRLVALTPSHQKNLIDHIPVKESQIRIIPHGADLKRFRPDNRDDSLRSKFCPPGKVLVGVVGRLDIQKGQREFVEALSLIKNNPRWQAVIIGDETASEPGEKKVLENMISQFGLADRVYLMPFQKDIEKYFAIMEIFVMPSHKETYGRVLIEAAASGACCISTRAGGVPDLIRHQKDGLLVNPKDANDLAKAIEQLVDDVDLRLKLVQNAQKRMPLEFDRAQTDQMWVDFFLGQSK